MPCDPVDPLLPHHREDLSRGSGLSTETIADAGLVSVTDGEQARQMLDWRAEGDPPPVPALAIPYPGPEPYVRLRPDNPRLDKDGKPIKYEAQVGRPARLYIPTTARSALGVPGAEIWITEGEKKSLAACQAGVPTIAVGGVYGFHDAAARRAAKERGQDVWPPAPELTQLARHPVSIVFDSDIDRKPQVMKALAIAVRIQWSISPMVYVAFLDSSRDEAKVGLDDLYVGLGGNAQHFREVLTAVRRPSRPSDMLTWLALRWHAWSDPQRRAEVRRAIGLYIQLLSSEELGEWKRQAIHALRISKKYLKEIEDDYRRSLVRRPRNDPNWMTAPGYTVSDDGVFLVSSNEDQNDRMIAAAPINIVEVGRDEDELHYASLRFGYGPEVLTATVPRLHVAGPELLHLAARGAPITQANRAYIVDLQKVGTLAA